MGYQPGWWFSCRPSFWALPINVGFQRIEYDGHTFIEVAVGFLCFAASYAFKWR